MTGEQVFISYAKATEAAFARRLAQCLRAAAFNVWLDEEQIAPGDDFQAAIRASLDKCQHALFVVSKAWLERDWTGYELEAFATGGPERRRIAILRAARGTLDVGPRLHRFHNVEWLESGSDEAACLWQVICGLTGEPPGPVEEWAARGGVFLAKVDRSVAAGGPQTALPPAPRARPVMRAGQDAHLSCDRQEQWGALVDLAARSRHQLILLPGAVGEAHDEFLKRIELRLPQDPPRRIVVVTWSDRPCPRQPERLFADLALALEVDEQALETVLRDQLGRHNLVVLQPPAHCFEGSALETYLTELLPRCLQSLGKTPFSMKVVQPIEWQTERTGSRLAGLWKAMVGVGEERPATLAGAFMDALETARVGELPVVRLPELCLIEPAQLEAFCELFSLPRALRKSFVEQVLRDARNSRDILFNIQRHFPATELQ